MTGGLTVCSVSSNASKIKTAIRLFSAFINQRLTESGIPIALEGQYPAKNVMGNLCWIGTSSVRYWKACPMQLPDTRDFLLSVFYLGGIDRLLGLEDSIDAFGGDDHLPLVIKDEW